MSVTVNTRFGELLARKRIDEKRAIPLSEVAEETGITRPTLYAWERNTVKSYSNEVIDKLCQYFSVQPGQLFEYVPDNE